MRKSAYTVLNIVFLFFIFFFFGGSFWLWKGKIIQILSPQSDVLPPALSFEDIKNSSVLVTVPNGGTSTSTPALVTSTLPVSVDLPKEMNLAVPFTSQAPEKNWDQPWQDACEEAAVLMMDAYYGNQKLSVLFSKDEILKMVKWEEEKNWGRSIEIEKVQDLVQYYMPNILTSKNLKTKIIENPTVEQIKKYVAAGTPVLVVADGKILPNPHFQNGGPEYHALVIRGYTETEFITNDPGTQFGENFKYKYHDLMKSIRDWNAGDVKNGRRVILVIE